MTALMPARSSTSLSRRRTAAGPLPPGITTRLPAMPSFATAGARSQARRGAYNPTYLYYTLGKPEIQDLAREYMAAKGATLRQFHDAFVAQGPLPIPLIRRILFR